MERKAQYIRILRRERSAAAARLIQARRTCDDLRPHRVMLAQRDLEAVNAKLRRQQA